MENHNFKKLLIVFTVILIISITTLVFFFTDYIYNLKNIIKNKTQSYIFIKWIAMGFLINILISFLLILANNYLKNLKGNIGAKGYKGVKGIDGSNCYFCL
jgi:hypothetical protein